MRFNLGERLQSLRMVAGLAQFLNNPDSLDSVFAIASSVQNSPLATQMGRHLLAEAGIQAMLKEKWRPAAIDLEALEAMPAGSLGYTYAHQLKLQGISPDSLIDPSPVTNEREFIVHRLRETHDIMHVLTGFGIDGPGELGLQAFNLAQNRSPLAVMLIFGGMLKVLQDDQPLEPLLQALSRGFQLGMAARCVISYKLEDGWERPLSEWRRELQLPENPKTGDKPSNRFNKNQANLILSI
jgi:ubiquinone biosynthesis protein Coq4